MNIQTTSTKQTWQSPDGSRTLFEVTFTNDEGKQMKALTYSQAIANMSFTGAVESYKKSDARGVIQTFLRQLPKDPATAMGKSFSSASGSIQDKDNRPMYFSYAKDLMIAVLNKSKYDYGLDAYGKIVESVMKAGEDLSAGSLKRDIEEVHGATEEIRGEDIDLPPEWA